MLGKWKSKAMGMMAAIMLFTGVCPMQALAFMEDADYVSIASGVVDSITVNGVTVDAMYQPYGTWMDTDGTYSCAAFVKRFYGQVFGRDVYGLNSIYSTPLIDSGEFYATNTPKVGDIVRDNVSVHWAIVKEVTGDGRVTVIQQNAWDSSYSNAMVNAKIRLDDSRYTFFRWNGNEGGQESVAPAANYGIEYGEQNVSETNAVLYAKVNNPNGVTVKQVGCYVWNENDELLKYHLEDCVRSETRFNMWYDLNAELGISLEPGTTYKYRFFVVDNGTEYLGDVQSFTTSGTKVSEAIPSELDIQNSIYVMMDLLFQSPEQIIDHVGAPVESSEYVYGYNIDTLFSKSGKVYTFFTTECSVEDVMWIYQYNDDSEASMIHSENFYNAIVKAMNGMNGVNMVESNERMESVQKDGLRVARDVVNGTPVITVEVGCQIG
ncbi:MAG: hypothetical protein PHG07_07290 [Lachnospiraceae bacterium]|nr:hypothetical protein [Lachnospiraceae bacterium]